MLNLKDMLGSGFTVRRDPAGAGDWYAPRGSRTHAGIDLMCLPGETVFSPGFCYWLRNVQAYESTPSLTGVLLKFDFLILKVLYITPAEDLISNPMRVPGEPLGFCQDITQRYPGQRMKPHIHIEVTSINPLFLTEPGTGGGKGVKA